MAVEIAAYLGATLADVPIVLLIFFLSNLIAKRFGRRILLTYALGIVLLFTLAVITSRVMGYFVFSVIWFAMIERIVTWRRKKKERIEKESD